jgi:hypothetical protein
VSFQEEVVIRFHVGQYEDESREQAEVFRLEMDTADTDLTNTNKRQKMMTTMGDRHVERREEFHSRHKDEIDSDVFLWSLL